jgi:hypothetical protein
MRRGHKGIWTKMGEWCWGERGDQGPAGGGQLGGLCAYGTLTLSVPYAQTAGPLELDVNR